MLPSTWFCCSPAQLWVSVRACFSEHCRGASSQVLFESPPESPGCDDPGPSTSASHGAGDGTAVPKVSSLVSASDHPEGAPSPPQPASPSGQPEAARPPACTGAVQAAQSKHRHVADQKLPVPAARAARSSHSPKKPFNTIIEHLSAVFPGYSRYEGETGWLCYRLSVTQGFPIRGT